MGLSPRGRGNPLRSPCTPRSERSIPAWAGEPRGQRSSPSYPAVYPRVGGGTDWTVQRSLRNIGLSPRGRGNLWCRPPSNRLSRSIPAWAGEPSPDGNARRRVPVYPRVGGGTACGFTSDDPDDGLSPRGRGNRLLAVAMGLLYGSIPAWAGNLTQTLLIALVLS